MTGVCVDTTGNNLTPTPRTRKDQIHGVLFIKSKVIHFDYEELFLIHQLGKVILSTLNKTFLVRYLAQRCCSSSGTCCDFANGGGNYNGGGYNNNNKPGNCPPYNGRKKRSPRGRFPGNNNNNRGSCIRDSDCSADLKCCYLRSGYQCTSPLGNYFG